MVTTRQPAPGRAGPRGILTARLARTDALGLALTVQLVFLIALATAFGILTQDVLAGGWLVGLDDPVADFLAGRRTGGRTAFFRSATHLGTVYVLIPVLLTLGAVARRRTGSWTPLAVLAITLGGASLTSTVTKLLVARPRPEADALVDALGYGFPSGHSTAAAAGWLAAALVTAQLTARVTVRVTAIVGAVVVAGVVGISRVYLRVHEITDVLAGWALGVLWLGAVLVAVRIAAHRRGRPVSSGR